MQRKLIQKSIFAFSLSIFIGLAPGQYSDNAPAPRAPEKSLKKHNVGIGAGYISGYGLTYRHWGENKHGFQASFVPIARVNEDETYINTSIGGIGMRSLHETRHTNFFAYYGGSYNYTYESRNPYYNYSPYNPENLGKFQLTEHTIHAGSGMGIEIHFWNLNYSLMIGYRGTNIDYRHVNATENGDYYYYRGLFDSGRSYKAENNGKWIKNFDFRPSVETGLFYSF